MDERRFLELLSEPKNEIRKSPKPFVGQAASSKCERSDIVTSLTKRLISKGFIYSEHHVRTHPHRITVCVLS